MGEPGAGDGELVFRLDGRHRIETAAVVSQEVFGPADASGFTGHGEEPVIPARAVVLARADAYPDALAGAPLAAANQAPLLLTDSTVLSPETEAEIDRLGVDRVVLLGGEAAIGPAVEAVLRAKGLVVERVGGANRYDTAALVAATLGADHDEVMIAEGEHTDPARGWPDALSAAPYAAYTGRPILLVTAARLPSETAGALERASVSEAIVVGGSAAVSQVVVDELAANGYATRRLAGDTRYTTSLAVYEEAVAAGMDPARLWLATGRNWPDALAAGPAVAARGATFLLIDGLGLDGSPAVRQELSARAGDYEHVYLVGGEAVITPEVEDEIRRTVTP